MIKEAICTGATIEEAREKALAELAAPEDIDVKIEVLEMPVKKTFGLFGGAPAKVRASYEESPAGKAIDYLKRVLEGMGIPDVTVKEICEDGHYRLDLDCGENHGAIIGRRGDTLDAIQYLGSLVLNNALDEHVRLSVDTENYREKRSESLERLARKMAMKVVKSHRSMTLEPMNPYERRIIHAALQDFNGVTTYSTGTEPGRRVVIAPDNSYRNRDRG